MKLAVAGTIPVTGNFYDEYECYKHLRLRCLYVYILHAYLLRMSVYGHSTRLAKSRPGSINCNLSQDKKKRHN